MDFNRIINFLDPMFDTKLKCSCIVDDFRPIENLISNDKQKLNLGFMAYHVVKPPVELEFHLCCSIELVSMKIWPQIDSLKSIGFEVFIKCDNVDSEYRKAANHFNLQTFGIQFINDSINIDHDPEMNFAVIPFFPSTKNPLRKVKSIKLVIKQTAKCAPVIKRIEVWGKVSKYASREQQNTVHQAITRATELNGCDNSQEPEQNEVKESNSSANEGIDTLSAIPEAFLDAITFEIMALPMVLPSGKTIDSSTLIKHTEHEEKWGRVPSDPFTGQPFTDTRKPVLDVHLKSQIDSFLLKNCEVPEISNLPRTVGSIPKRRIEPNEGCSSRDSKIPKEENTHLNSTPQSSEDLTNKIMTQHQPSSSAATSSLSSVQRKVQTLDEAIRGVLKVGKYTASTSVKLNGINSPTCFQCPEMITNILYTITTCCHLICRNCLIDRNLNVCKCGKPFSNIDVNKYHRREIL